jgi:hypothetical protein
MGQIVVVTCGGNSRARTQPRHACMLDSLYCRASSSTHTVTRSLVYEVGRNLVAICPVRPRRS